MGLTRRKDSYYVELSVLDDGNTLTLARNTPGAKLKRWKVGCKNKEEARKQEAIIRTQLLQGLSLVLSVQATPLTVNEYVTKWLESAKSSLAPKTHRSYSQLIRLHILPGIGDRAITTLAWADVKGLLNKKQETGLSPNSVRLIRGVISSILTDAAEDGVISGNPVLGQRRKRRAHQVLTPEVCPMNWEQKRAFEAKLDEREQDGLLMPSYAMLLRICLMAGLRPSEGRALKPGDIDFMGRRIRVER